jgi:pimeloyl-ACP methyl ester carboxylesterase
MSTQETLDYQTHGKADNPPLLLLHAGGMTKGEWDPFIDAWSKHFYLIVPDALAHGSSPNVPSISIAAMADATLALLDSVGIERAHILGSSMGGATAIWIALTAPERVDKLVIYRTSYHSTEEVHEGVLRMAEPETWQQWRLDKWMSEQHEPQGGPDAWTTVTQKVAAAFDPADSEHLHDLGDLATISSPTLIIAGDRDPVVSLEDATAMYHTIPDAALWIVPNATHFMGMEGWRRPTFEQEILRFLRRQ